MPGCLIDTPEANKLKAREQTGKLILILLFLTASKIISSYGLAYGSFLTNVFRVELRRNR